MLCAASWSALVAGCATVPGAAPAVSAPAPHVALGAGVREVGLIVEPRDGVRPLTQAIRDATTSVWLTMYLLTDRTIIHDLEYAHAYGVDVRVILEPHPYGMLSDPNRYAYDNLMAADIPVHWARPRFLLTHEKSMLVDDTAYIMSANFTRSAFRSNRDLGVVDRDRRDVAALRALFLADWRGRSAMPRDPNLPVSPSDARSLLTALIGSAQHTLDIYAEELQDPAIVRALSAAARRGVRVRVILPAPSGPDPDAEAVAAVRRAGAQVHRLPPSYLYAHAKAIVTDGQRAFVGSENLSAASLDRNRELGVIIADRRAIATLRATFMADWRHGTGNP
jgi:phosphatidylserine/phosphatidylglycerophosphate/cardiolipin synthase-like enzyme